MKKSYLKKDCNDDFKILYYTLTYVYRYFTHTSQYRSVSVTLSVIFIIKIQ